MYKYIIITYYTVYIYKIINTLMQQKTNQRINNKYINMH